METTIKQRTIIVLVLDESSSMHFRKEEVIEGFKNFLFEQKNDTKTDVYMTMFSFNESANLLFMNCPIKYIKGLTDKTYQPYGPSRLYDTVSSAISLADKVKPQDQVIFTIITNGQDNFSKTTLDEIKAIIKERDERSNWSFVYIGKQPENWGKEKIICYLPRNDNDVDCIDELNQRIAETRKNYLDIPESS